MKITGADSKEKIIIESSDSDCIIMQTDSAIVWGLTLRCKAGVKGKSYPNIDIRQGQLLLENCDITSDSLSCVLIHGSDAKPIIRNCHIHDGKQGGIFVYDKGRGKIENCNIFNNSVGVVVIEGSNPVIRNCKIYDGKYSGILIHQNGKGILEDCDIFNNVSAGVETREGGDPKIYQCRINQNSYVGLWAYSNGKGTVENCDLTDNISGAFEIDASSYVWRYKNQE